MRQALSNLDVYRGWFLGTLAAINPDRAVCLIKDVILLEDFEELGERITDHVWMDWEAFERTHSQKGDRLVFMATVRAYQRKNRTWDYGLEKSCWVQPFTLNPQPLPVRSVPQTQEEAGRLLSERMLVHRLHPDRYPIEDWNDWGIRVYQWSESIRECLEELVQEGWGEYEPSPLEFWLEQSPALKKLHNSCGVRSLYRYAEIAAICNGVLPKGGEWGG